MQCMMTHDERGVLFRITIRARTRYTSHRLSVFINRITPYSLHTPSPTSQVINYIAAYTFNTSTATWAIDATSSFNTDARFPAYDLMQPYGGIGATATRLLRSLFKNLLARLPEVLTAVRNMQCNSLAACDAVLTVCRKR